MKTPYFAFFPGDYLADTIGLSCCEHGVYLLLLAASWQRGPLPDNMDHLSRLAANPPIEALRYILENYWSREEQGWINNRLELERERLSDLQQKRSAAGKKAVAVREAKRDSISSSNRSTNDKQSTSTHTHTHTHTQNHNQTQTHTHTSTSKERKTPPKTPLVFPNGLEEKTWLDFRESRRRAKASMTHRAEQLVLSKLKALCASGENPNAIVEQSIERGWKSVFPLSGDSRHNGNHDGTGDWLAEQNAIDGEFTHED